MPDDSLDARSMDAASRENLQAAEPSEQQPPVNLPPGLTPGRVVEWAKVRNKKFEQWSQKEFKRIEDWHRLFEGQHIAGTIKAATFIPVPNAIVETDTARRTSLMFSRPKVVDAIPQVITPDNERTQDIEDFINQEILASVRTAEKGYDAFKGQGIEGTGIGKCFWEIIEYSATEPDYKTDPFTGIKVQVGERQVMKTRGRWNWNPVALPYMAWDPRLATRIQDSPWARERAMVTLNELLHKEVAGEVQDIDKIERMASAIKEPTAKDGEAARKRALGEQQLPEGDGDDGVYQLDEWHADITWKAPGPDGKEALQSGKFRFWIVNDQYLVKFEDNPLDPKRIPYFSFRYSIRPRRFLGNGILAPIADLEVYANNLMASSQELIKKAAQNPTFYEKASGIDGRKTIVTEGAMIPVLDASRIKHFPVDVGAIDAVDRKLSSVINLMRETTASNEQAQGISGEGDTATEAAILARASGARFQAVVDLAAWEFFAQGLAQEAFWFYKQFGADGEMIVRMPSGIDGKSKVLTRADLQADYMFVPVTSTNEVAKNAEVKNYISFFERLMELQTKAPQALTDKSGKTMRFDFVGAITNEIMPRLGIRNGNTYWQEIQPLAAAPLPGTPPVTATGPLPTAALAAGPAAMGESLPVEA